MGNFFTYENLDTKDYANATDSVWNTLYSMFIALWTTLFVESWRQKQVWLANRWLVQDFNQQSFDRKDFKASLNFDLELRDAFQYQENMRWKKRKGYIVSFVFMAFVIGVYIGI